MFIIRTIPRRRAYFAQGMFAVLRETLKVKPSETKSLVRALESNLASILKIPNPVAVASGKLGLRLILETSGLSQGTEVLLPGYTFGPLYPVIRAAGFVPVPVDINPDTFQMEPSEAQKAINTRTGAVVATHLFGEPCDVDGFFEMTRKYGLLMIEDCAQALGARIGDRMVGTIGDAGFASFDISKPLQGVRGGVAFSRNKVWMDRIRERVKSYGIQHKIPFREITGGYLTDFLVGSPLWRVFMVLFSFKTTQKLIVMLYRRDKKQRTLPGSSVEMQNAELPDALAYIIRLNLQTFEQRLERRRAIRALYRELLDEVFLFQKLNPDADGTVYMVVARARCDVYRLRRYLTLRGVDVALGAEIADDCLNHADSAVGAVFREAVALPVYEELKDSDVHYIAGVIREFFKP
ncbi:MAG: DegT/DnrJ/EryC1/StrS family aminotransferase [bacterium]